MKTLNKTIFGILVILGITLVFAQVKSTNEIVFCENTNPNKFLDDAISKIQKIHPALGVNTCVRLETSSKISATARNNPDEIVLTTGLMNRLKEEEEKKVNSGEAILVFILSHELGHFALKHSHSCSDSNAKESERQADLYGAFLTFVTGFDSSLLSPLKTVLPNSENDSCHDNIKERVATLHTKSDKFREQARKFDGIMELVSKYNTAEQADELEKKANEIKKIQEEIFTKEKVGKDIPILTLALATIYHKSWILKYPSYDELSYMATIYFPVDLTSDTTRGVNRQNLTMEYYDARGMYKSYLEKVPNDSKVMMNYLLLLMYDELPWEIKRFCDFLITITF